MSQRIDVPSSLALGGAGLLLLSLFLEWFAPGLSGWDVFESLDLVLAALALVVAATATGRLDRLVPAAARSLPVLAGAAFLVVGVQLVGPPPAAPDGDREIGAWLALLATLLMVAGAALRVARVSIVLDVRENEPPPTAVTEPQAADPRPGQSPPGRP